MIGNAVPLYLAYDIAESVLEALSNSSSKVRPAKIEKNGSFYSAERAWSTLTDSEKAIYKISELAGVNTIFELEPLILDDGLDELELKIQSDDKGNESDVRDVVIIKRGIE